MLINNVLLKSFRNHSDLNIKFSPGINVIWGKNGTGKTSILEAVHLLLMGKSFKTNKTQETIKNNCNTSLIKGSFSSNNRSFEISLNQTTNKPKSFMLDGVKTKPKIFIGRLPIVLLSPEEEKTTKGQPTERRRFFDKLYSLLSKDYLNILIKYNSILRNRNNVLKKTNNYNEVLPWDVQLAKHGVSIWEKRNIFNRVFLENLIKTSEKYNPNTILSFAVDSKKTETDEYIEELKKSFNKDLKIKRTSFGPHKDVYSFFLNKKNLKVYGSQGEHKIAFTLIKFAEYETLKTQTKKSPTILLDDLFARLDSDRSSRVLTMLEQNTQTIITNTDLTDIKNRGINTGDSKNKDFYLEKIWKN